MAGGDGAYSGRASGECQDDHHDGDDGGGGVGENDDDDGDEC